HADPCPAARDAHWRAPGRVCLGRGRRHRPADEPSGAPYGAEKGSRSLSAAPAPPATVDPQGAPGLPRQCSVPALPATRSRPPPVLRDWSRSTTASLSPPFLEGESIPPAARRCVPSRNLNHVVVGVFAFCACSRYSETHYFFAFRQWYFQKPLMVL